jgi:hypothetical protein
MIDDNVKRSDKWVELKDCTGAEGEIPLSASTFTNSEVSGSPQNAAIATCKKRS